MFGRQIFCTNLGILREEVETQKEVRFCETIKLTKLAGVAQKSERDFPWSKFLQLQF